MKKFGTKLLLATLTISLGLSSDPGKLTTPQTAALAQEFDFITALKSSCGSALATVKTLDTTITKKGFELGDAAYNKITPHFSPNSCSKNFMDRIASLTAHLWEHHNTVALRVLIVAATGYAVRRAIQQGSVWPSYIIWGTPKNQAIAAKKQLRSALIAVQRPKNEPKEKLTVYTEYGFIANKIINFNSVLNKANTCLFKKNATTKEYEEAKEIFDNALSNVETIYKDYNEITTLVYTAKKAHTELIETTGEQLNIAYDDEGSDEDSLDSNSEGYVKIMSIWENNTDYMTASNIVYDDENKAYQDAELRKEELEKALKTFTDLNTEQSISDAKAAYEDYKAKEEKIESAKKSDFGIEEETTISTPAPQTPTSPRSESVSENSSENTTPNSTPGSEPGCDKSHNSDSDEETPTTPSSKSESENSSKDTTPNSSPRPEPGCEKSNSSNSNVWDKFESAQKNLRKTEPKEKSEMQINTPIPLTPDQEGYQPGNELDNKSDSDSDIGTLIKTEEKENSFEKGEDLN